MPGNVNNELQIDRIIVAETGRLAEIGFCYNWDTTLEWYGSKLCFPWHF